MSDVEGAVLTAGEGGALTARLSEDEAALRDAPLPPRRPRDPVGVRNSKLGAGELLIVQKCKLIAGHA